MNLTLPFDTAETPELSQVGGVLQHGALAAREYGKPCIAGIENATSLIREGQMIELNGSNGVVKMVWGLESGGCLPSG